MSTETKYLVQYELEGEWHTIARRSSFTDACRLARKEGRAMKWERMTAVIKEGDPEILRRTAENNFEI